MAWEHKSSIDTGPPADTHLVRGMSPRGIVCFVVLLAVAFAGAARANDAVHNVPDDAPDDYAPTVDAWPLFRSWSSPDKAGRSFEALWPLVEWHDTPAKSGLCIRPLYTRRRKKSWELVESDILWPIGSGTTRPGLSRHVFYPLFLRDRENLSDGAVRRRWALLPFFYWRRGRAPTDLFVFPFGGVLHDLAGHKRIVFVLWPIFLYQEREDVRKWNLLHPLVTIVRWHDGGKGFKLWPLFGWNRRPGKLRKFFALWPLFQREWRASDDGEFRRLFIFPFYGSVDDPRGKARTVLWPFFGHRVDYNSAREDWWYPWPLAGHHTGLNTSGITAWPLYQYDARPGLTDANVLWPMGWYHRDRRKGKEAGSLRFVPFFFREWEQTRAGRCGAWQLWPLMKCRRGPDRALEVEFPSVFPFRYHAEFERNLAPLFRVCRFRRAASGHWSWRVWHRLIRVDNGPRDRYVEIMPLFDIHQRRGQGAECRWNVLKGLIGYERTGARTRWRLLYFIRIGSAKTSSQGDSPP